MNKAIHDNQLNRVFLKPRFKMEIAEDKGFVIDKFKQQFSNPECKYCGKIVDHHIVIDVPKDEDTFWSPQLSLEVEKNEEGKTFVRGLFGPKPQIWTMFMFFHFAVAVAFVVFAVMAYTKYLIKEDYTVSLIMLLIMPVLWFVLYFLGQLGKKKGYKQMLELDSFMKKILSK